ncbi:MAG TPA: thioesterase family protein [Solimonas sp.]|nr:thioesterase family protein [Solimonas sp.]
MSDSFRYYLRVRYGECDAQKVVFNARYGEYVELAVSEFMRALGFETELVSGELDYQLVKQTVEWKAPSRYDDVVECRVAASHLGNTSFAMRVEFRGAGAEALRASAETVYVMVDQALQKRPLPEAFRAALQRGAPGMVADHAAYLA